MKQNLSERKIFLDEVYEKINSPRKRYGTLKKCEFHIHTPESPCYRFISTIDSESDDLERQNIYLKLSTKEVIDYAKEVGYLKYNNYNKIIEDIDYYESDDYIRELNDNIKNSNKKTDLAFNSFKEYITYMTIAYKLYKEDIKVAIVSDHNTIKGYKKLQYAINKYYNETFNNQNRFIKLFLGVEISCSDKNHLMIIYDENKYEQLQKYLDEIILKQEYGTYYDTRKVIEDMKEQNAIAYIAHINTSDLLGNIAYKEKLFNSNGLNGIGVSNINTIEREKIRVKGFRKDISDIAVVYEGDSHSINEMGIKNTWIKLSDMNFKSLKKAFLNHQVCIYTSEQQPVSKYIKGLVVEKGEDGFLGESPNKVKGDKEDVFLIDFSQDLNCIIGGRGSGKSTILNILEVIYSMECDDLELLKYISQHRRIFSLFIKNDEEYLIEFVPQITNKGHYYNSPVIFQSSYEERGERYKLKTQWYNLFKIVYENNSREYIEVDRSEISYLLKSIFRRGYNINKLVDKINSKEISNYIKEVVTYNVEYEDISNYIKKIKEVPSTRVLKVIRESLKDIILMVNNRREAFANTVKDFNYENKNVLRIHYEPMYETKEYLAYFIKIFEKSNINSSLDKILTQHVKNTYLTWGDVQTYFIEMVKKINYFEILELILNQRFSDMDKILSIENFQSKDISFKGVEMGLEIINSKNKNEVYKEIFVKIKSHKNELKKSIIKCFKVIDNFNIEFNVNFKEDVLNNSVNFKKIGELSLGQKVVALLTFVFNFSNIAGDNTPLIIDQPEDNLDNVYIYKTLVNSLKCIKNSRQVIVVTHSSTIVTNADAEKVIVMKSNGEKGWIEKSGYPSEEAITKHIINYLEGGIGSFNHKRKMYGVILDKF